MSKLYNMLGRIPIRLQLTPAYQSRSGDAHTCLFAEPISPALKQAVYQRDGKICRFCGFHAAKYQNVLALHGRVRDMDDLFTTCGFCHQCFRVDHVSAMRSGVLAYLPEISQADLHHVARDLYRARITQSPHAIAARDWLNQVLKKENKESRRTQAVERLGTDTPLELTSMFHEARDPQARTELEEKLEGIRLFPLDRRIIKEGDLEFNQFPQILAFWRSKSGPFTRSGGYPWLSYAVEALGGNPPVAEASLAFPTAQTDSGLPYLKIALGYLYEAKEVIKSLAEQHPSLSDTLFDRVVTAERIAQACMTDADATPDASLQKMLNEACGSGNGLSVRYWAGAYLGEIARYFDMLAAAKVPNIPRNTQQLKLLSRLLQDDVVA